MTLFSKRIVTPNGVIEGFLTVQDGKITSISPTCSADFIDCSEDIIMPGYIDLHIHGWATGSFWMEKSPESLWKMQTNLPKVGVTSFLGTTGADSIKETFRSIKSGNEAFESPKKGAELLGIHMEGPFISKDYKGLQREEDCIFPDIDLMEEFYASASPNMIKLMTLAPELPNADLLIQFNKKHGIQSSIGHSGASFEQIQSLKGYGLGGVTHMFSGMNKFHHRELGVVGAALYYEDLLCEFAKQTGQTVKHEAFDFVFRLKGADKLYLSSDCQGLARSTEPFYHYIRGEEFAPENGLLKITKDNGDIRYVNPNHYEEVKDLELSYEKSVINMMNHTKMDLVELSKVTSLTAAKYISVDQRKGSLEVGKDADILLLNDEYGVEKTYCLGALLYERA